MSKRNLIVSSLAVVCTIALGLIWFLPSSNSVDSLNSLVWLGAKEIELESEIFPLGYLNRKRMIAPTVDASEVISLYGRYGNGAAEENVIVEKLADGIRLRAWWVTPYGDTWLIDTSMTKSDLDQLWTTLQDNRAFELKDEALQMSHAMKYWLTIKKDGREHEASVYGAGWYSSTTFASGGPQLSPEWGHVIRAILKLRSTFAHQVRLAGIAGRGSGVSSGKTRGEVLVDEIAAKQIKFLKRAIDEEELTWEMVLDVGYYRNRKIVEMVVSLLDSPDAKVSAAACAVMSWTTGEPPNADREHWKHWWDEHASDYRPVASSAIEGDFGNGVIRNLGGFAKGFIEVENDDDDNVWALIKTHSSWDRNTYRLYRLDRKSEKFIQTTMSRNYESKSETPPPARFFRRVAETGIRFPETHIELWVSPTGNWGAAILGHESDYLSDSVVILDFKNSKMRQPLRTDDQYSSPVVSSDGSYVAVSKDSNWAKPNSALVIDTETEKEQLVPIPPGNLGPIAFVDDSPNGPGFYLVRKNESDDQATLWWCSPNGHNAKQLLTLPKGLTAGVRGNNIVTSDGVFVFSVQQIAGGLKSEAGWLNVVDGTFEPVIPSSAWPLSVDATSDGSRVVFIHGGKVFQWQRFARPDAKPNN